jgi:acetamidase/formamidase
MSNHQRLEAGPDTVHWGYFDAQLKPMLTVDCGARVTITTVSGGPDANPPAASGLKVPASLAAVQDKLTMKLPGHMCTGPVAVRGAKAGGVLQVDIEAIDLHYDWGYTRSGPLMGALPDDFPERQIMHIPLDRARMVGRLPWGYDIPLRPFFGVMGTAPPAAWGMVNTLPPRRNGGNLDNKDLVAGTTLYLPVHVDGALFSVGDGHGVQGDGEVCITAIETGLIGTFRLTARNDMHLIWPQAETPTQVMTMAFDPDLDTCVVIALRDMVALVAARVGITKQEAYMLCSLAADLRITQVVNGNKGVHVVIDKAHLNPRTR